MKRRFKFKKRFKYKKFLYLFITVIFVITLSKIYVKKIKLLNSNTEMLNIILDSSNTYSNKNNIIDNVSKYINNNIFNSPIFLLKSEFNITNSQKSLSNTELVNFIYEENDLPLVYIYNSHQGETYSMKYLENYNITPNVLTASKMLKDKLESLNIKTIVEEADILDYMNKNNLNHAGSYIASRAFLEPAIKKYKTVKLFIDLHRDAATHQTTYTSFDDKDYAKVLFVIGLENNNYQKNLDVTTKINNIILNKYPNLTRGIMKKQGYGVNGVYNQDLDSRVILLELGGNENNIDEINNTLDIIANVIKEYINEKK